MKPFGKTKDGVIDILLRGYVSRPANPSLACPEFDPDLANAYIERRLPSGSRSRYEHHLSECGACRKNVVALVRLADTQTSVSPGRDRDRAAWLSGVSRVFGAMSRPQWAMATAAVQTSAANAEAAKQPAVGTLATNTKPTNAESPTSGPTATKKRDAETEAM